jgi:hypothetical protein
MDCLPLKKPREESTNDRRHDGFPPDQASPARDGGSD